MSFRVRTKICGITRRDDALMAIDAGADAIGLVFYPPSPRNVSVEQARKIVSALPAFVSTTALFVNAQPELVKQVIAEVGVDLLQFHGEETAQSCRAFGRPYIKAIAMQAHINLVEMAEHYYDARALLLDTYKPGVPGGTGESFNWQWVRPLAGKPLILAGGLTPDNVAQAIAQTGVYAVDVSGGVEASKGVKCAEKVQQFIKQANVMSGRYK
jgi:phosphoribosylanthranilate isomerase